MNENYFEVEEFFFCNNGHQLIFQGVEVEVIDGVEVEFASVIHP